MSTDEGWSRDDVSDFAIADQMSAIRDEIKATQKEVGDVEDPKVLMEEYKDNTNFHHKIQNIIDRYGGVRRSRGDGSCFYRSFVFGYFERIKDKPDEIAKAVTHAGEVKTLLFEKGYPEFTVSDFHENYVDVLNEIAGVSTAELETILRDAGNDQYTVYFARLVTSAYMQSHPDEFLAFCMAMGHADIQSYCKSQVEGAYVDADQLQITALTNSFQVHTRIAYLDGSSGDLNHHDFPEDKASAGVAEVCLLYRPGHYDLLYPK
jgi:ubiquitin thioesterase protein OTUB1|eukprot:Stramenopile-MAST_4_protein_5645